MNIAKLTNELQIASLPCIGISLTEDGGDDNSVRTDGVRVDLSRAISNDEMAQMSALIAAHTPTWLSPRVQSIVADGEDVGVVTISGNPGASVAIDIMAGETPSQETVILDDAGTGQLQVSCAVPGTRILITADGQSVVVQAA